MKKNTKKMILLPLASLLALSSVPLYEFANTDNNSVEASTYSSRNLSYGMSGTDVNKIQSALKSLGYFTYPKTTNYYGTYTRAAVVAFQKANGLKQTGVADQNTQAQIQKIVSNKTAAKSTATTNKTTSVVTKDSTGKEIASVSYTIQKGDTLFSLAKEYNTTVESILNNNKSIKSASKIFVGQKITIVTKNPGVVKEVTNTTATSNNTASKSTSASTTKTPTSTTKQTKPAASNTKASQATAVALKYNGGRYQWGGSSPKTSFDCSGLVQYSFKQVGVSLPRTSREQYKVGTAVSKANLKYGDLVFFSSNGPRGTITHVGIYVGNGKFFGAQSSGIGYANLNTGYWAGKYVGAKRVAN